MNTPNPLAYAGVPQQRTTRWHNPTSHPQRVVINDGNGVKFLFEVSPGETRELDSRYDRAIHMIDCGREECHRKGWFCHVGHEGSIVGGGAPMLRRVGKTDTMDPSLDPELAAKRARDEKVKEKIEEQKLLAEAHERQQAEAAARSAPPAAPPAAAPQPSQKTK